MKTYVKISEDYQQVSRYDIVRIESVEKLIVPIQNDLNTYICMEENFQIIREIRIAIGHETE